MLHWYIRCNLVYNIGMSIGFLIPSNSFKSKTKIEIEFFKNKLLRANKRLTNS